MDLERALTHAIEDAVKFACDECGIEGGDILSDQKSARFARVVSNRLEPFLVHMIFGSKLTGDDRLEIERKTRA